MNGFEVMLVNRIQIFGVYLVYVFVVVEEELVFVGRDIGVDFVFFGVDLFVEGFCFGEGVVVVVCVEVEIGFVVFVVVGGGDEQVVLIGSDVGVSFVLGCVEVVWYEFGFVVGVVVEGVCVEDVEVVF